MDIMSMMHGISTGIALAWRLGYITIKETSDDTLLPKLKY
jgi:hypothetical protein